MSGSRKKLRAVLLSFVMVTSIMGAGVAFSGSAAAAASGAQINSGQPVQGDQSVTLEFSAASTNDHIIGIDADDIPAGKFWNSHDICYPI